MAKKKRGKTKGAKSKSDGVFKFVDSFERVVDEDYLVPRGGVSDPYIGEEGLYPSAVVPEYFIGKTLVVVYESDIMDLGLTNEEEKKFHPTYGGFEQKVVKRRLIPSRSRNYSNGSPYTVNSSSPTGLYPTVILPKSLVGKVIRLFYSD